MYIFFPNPIIFHCRLSDLTDYGRLLIDTFPRLKMVSQAGRFWLTPIILATQETEIKRITVQSK
jgi:hypothetical protein